MVTWQDLVKGVREKSFGRVTSFLALVLVIRLLCGSSDRLPVLLLLPPILLCYGWKCGSPFPKAKVLIVSCFLLVMAFLEVCLETWHVDYFNSSMYPTLGWELAFRAFIFNLFSYASLAGAIILGEYCRALIGKGHSPEKVYWKREHVRFYFEQIARIGVWLIDGIALYFFSVTLKGEKGLVVIGSTDWSFSDSVDIGRVQKEQYYGAFDSLLGGYSRIYEIDVKVIGKPYFNLIGSVINDRVDIGTVSPYTYLYYSRNHPGIMKRVRFIGKKYTTAGQTYNPGFLMKKDHSRHISDAKGLLNPKNSLKLLISDERLSTSTRVVPLMVMIEAGHQGSARAATSISRLKMLEELNEDTCLNGCSTAILITQRMVLILSSTTRMNIS